MRASCGKPSRSGSTMHPSCPTRLLPPLPRRNATIARRLPLALRCPHDSTNGSSRPSLHLYHHPPSRAAILPAGSPSPTPSPSALPPLIRLAFSRPRARSPWTTSPRNQLPATTIRVHHYKQATATIPSSALPPRIRTTPSNRAFASCPPPLTPAPTSSFGPSALSTHQQVVVLAARPSQAAKQPLSMAPATRSSSTLPSLRALRRSLASNLDGLRPAQEATRTTRLLRSSTSASEPPRSKLFSRA